MFESRLAPFAAALALAVTMFPEQAEARKQCRPDGHMHHGQSDGQPTKGDARRDAIASWSSFTELEYGNRWSNFRNARYKKISCFNRQAGWSCAVEGNPCKGRLRRSARK